MLRRTFPEYYNVLRRLERADFDSYMAYTWPVHLEARRLFRGRRLARTARAIYEAGDAHALRAALHALDLVWHADDRPAAAMRARRKRIVAAFDRARLYWECSLAGAYETAEIRADPALTLRGPH